MLGAVSPMARLSPRAVALATLVAFPLLALSGTALLASAQGGEGTNNSTSGGDSAGGADFVMVVRESPLTPASPYAFNVAEFTAPAGATVHLVYDSTAATGLHNAHPRGGSPVAGYQEGTTIDANAGLSSWTFTMPASGEVEFACDIHSEMKSKAVVGEGWNGGTVAGGGGGAEHITKEGVNFLAHWVGVIAFAVLFIVYGLTFFLFKYNETPFTTDHKDRAVPAGSVRTESYGEPLATRRETVVVMAVLLTVLAVALVYAIVNGWIG